MSQLLVADIGGTNARFGLVELSTNAGQQNYGAQQQKTLKCADYPDIATMIKAYCSHVGASLPPYACLAIAGPIEKGWAQMTNLNWKFSIEDLRKELGMKALDVINDFAALAYATPFLPAQDIKPLYTAKSSQDSAIVVLGPGTGFGMAALVPDHTQTQRGWKILPTEGGHCSFAPTTDKEMAIRAFLAQTDDHVSIEDILSGRGLVSIYRALSHINGTPAQDFTPAEVSTKGLANEDPTCREALVTFCNILGSVAGDKALSLGAKGGVYLGGGIIPKIASFIPQTDFVSRFKHKGPMSGYVSDISVNMIINDTAALVGSAAWLINTALTMRGE